MSRERLVAAAVAILGVVGLGLSFLPLVTVSASARFLQLSDSRMVDYLFGDSSLVTERWAEYCREYQEYCPGGGEATVGVSGYDVLSWGFAASALIPIALACAIAVGALHAWRGRDPRVFTFLSLASAGALVVLLFTWINPSIALSGSGEFATLDDAATSGSTGSGDLTTSVGLGLYLPAVVLVVVFALSTRQAVTPLIERRRAPVPMPMVRA